jgi:hypothetical protein
VSVEQVRNFSIFGADEDGWPACSGDAVEFAWNDQSLKLGLQGNEVRVGN